MPSPSISWIYTSIGCQHTLQPTSDDFKPPSIPALTTRGFVRWQSIEILLGPEEHVPFIQTAVRNFAIKNPDTGETFPVDLPTEAFPLIADKDIEKWHNQCAEKLRQRATPNEEDEGPRPDLPPRPRVRTGMAYVRPGAGAARKSYFEPKYRSRPIPYQHVSAAGGGRPIRPKLSRSPSHQARQFLAPEAPSSPYSRGRRRSFPENVSNPSSPLATTDGHQPPAMQAQNVRRHSHPRHARRGSRSSDASSSSEGNGGDGADDPPSPGNVSHVPGAAAARRRSHTSSHTSPRDDPPVIRFPPAPPPPSTSASTPTDANPNAYPKPRRRISRDRASEEEEVKRQSFVIPVDLTGKLSAPFLLGNRPRERRNNSRGPTVTWKDLNGIQVDGAFRRGSKSSEEERWSPDLSRKSSRDEGREKERDRDSGSSGSRRRRPRERDGEVEAEGNGERARPLLRERRYSSHEDVMRRPRDRDYDRDREREVVGRSFRDRDREPVRGVDGRKYPSAR